MAGNVNPALVQMTKFINTAGLKLDLFRTYYVRQEQHLRPLQSMELTLPRGSRLALVALAGTAMAACGGGGGGNKGGGQSPVTVSGTVSYERFQPNANCQGLDVSLPVVRPIRGATVQLLDNGGGVLDATVSDDDGRYAFQGVAANRSVRLRVRAELKRPGAPGWDVEIRDNYDDSASPPALATRPLYVLDGVAFDTGTTGVTRDLTATTGWTGNAYAAPRAAAPFAILDTIYTAMQFVLTADATATFPGLDVFWSVNNTPGPFGNVNLGEVGTSFYAIDRLQLFLLGDADRDTEEFDAHVVAHEWGHYFEDALSRSDSGGGSHIIGESLEASLAFGEAWGYAIATMSHNDPLYCDTGPVGTNGGFEVDAENDSYGVQGWFNEWSLTTFLYDLWDTDDDGTDTGSIGFAPIYNILTGPQVTTEAFTSVFSFAAELRAALDPAGQALVDSQLARENIVAGAALDIWATNETNDAGLAQDVFPLYTNYTADGTVINLCVNDQLDGLNRHGNNLGQDRYLRINVPVTDEYDVTVVTTTPTPVTPDPDDRDQSDPDFYVLGAGREVARGNSGTANFEQDTTSTLQAGETYAMFLEEWRFGDPGAATDYPSRICFDVSLAPTP